ncbi:MULTISPECIES: 8-oxo-dGTP diphosphatase [unclassified Meiothermus]|uniref:8-oxo-dGTP diphosphatase n=1 Tax=unclassified Meiothermus TaxID=370471 RepID=UPI000D7BD489|nr:MULTISPECIES: 8-oxo-dGTP diphosphatase [unclassified Meiothermus]PZA08512.1 DNA mismatch repair protein MutT [Meiothermus sp. Pnk-1]RYM36883.1 8-oxo-dGTP diphosphatase [Meiothermus sp. PNK-Is4]
MTLCAEVFVLDRPRQRILLGRKKRGLGVGRYQGFGGKLEPGETLLRCAVRELWEESRLEAQEHNLWYMAHLLFVFPGKPQWSQEVHVFRLEHWEGEPQETEEMRPEWFDLKTLPLTQMWDDVKYWLPQALEGARPKLRFVYTTDGQQVERVEKLVDPS